MYALSRLLKHEDRVSDLIAALAELDPEPLRKLLKLPDTGELTVRREVNDEYRNEKKRKRKTGRMDLVVYLDGHPKALFEVKMAAGSHGTQFRRYEDWCEKHDLTASDRYLVTLAGEWVPGDRGDWQTALTVPDLVGEWRSSQNTHVAWLAGQAHSFLADLVAQFNGDLGDATHPVVADLVAKQLLGELAARESAQVGVNLTAKNRGGGASALAWVLPPGHEEDDEQVYLTMELQVWDKQHPGKGWSLQLGVAVDRNDPRTAAEAGEAHDLAMRILPYLKHSTLLDALKDSDQRKLADALVADSNDGFRTKADEADLASWRDEARNVGNDLATSLPRHPLFYRNLGTRMSSQLRVNVRGLNRDDLLRLLEFVLNYLEPAAASLTEGHASEQGKTAG